MFWVVVVTRLIWLLHEYNALKDNNDLRSDFCSRSMWKLGKMLVKYEEER
jgi:hypothetical protein